MRNRALLAAVFSFLGALARAQSSIAVSTSTATKPHHPRRPPRQHAPRSKTVDPQTAATLLKLKAADDAERTSRQALAVKLRSDMQAVYDNPSLTDAQRSAQLDAIRKNDIAQSKSIGDKARAARKGAFPPAPTAKPSTP